MNYIQADRMKIKVKRYQLRLLNSTSPTHVKIKSYGTIIYVALPAKTMLLLSIEDACPLGKNEDLYATLASLAHLLQNLQDCE